MEIGCLKGFSMSRACMISTTMKTETIVLVPIVVDTVAIAVTMCTRVPELDSINSNRDRDRDYDHDRDCGCDACMSVCMRIMVHM